MCGLYFHFSKDKINKKKSTYQKNRKKFLNTRGPDGLNVTYKDNWFAFHSLLSITHNKIKQPYFKNFVSI